MTRLAFGAKCGAGEHAPVRRVDRLGSGREAPAAGAAGRRSGRAGSPARRPQPEADRGAKKSGGVCSRRVESDQESSVVIVMVEVSIRESITSHRLHRRPRRGSGSRCATVGPAPASSARVERRRRAASRRRASSFCAAVGVGRRRASQLLRDRAARRIAQLAVVGRRPVEQAERRTSTRSSARRAALVEHPLGRAPARPRRTAGRSAAPGPGAACSCAARRTVQTSRSAASKVIIAGGGDGPLPERVEAAAVAGPSPLSLVVRACRPICLPEPGGLVRLDARPAERARPAGRSRPGRCRGSSRPAAGAAGRGRAARCPGRCASSSGVGRPTTAGRSPTVTISRSSAFTSQPESTNSRASQSSSSGWWAARPGCRSPRPSRRCPGRRSSASSG